LTVVPPQGCDVSESWNDVAFLTAQLQAKFGESEDQYYDQSELLALIDKYEPMPYAEDPGPTLRAARRRVEGQDEESMAPCLPGGHDRSSLLTPSALLCKLDRLLRDGSELVRYTPPDGNGWGVNGELDEDWISFREKGDGSCIFEDGRDNWWTEEPDRGWTIIELAMLADLRKKTLELPLADLPSAASHPGLFVKAEAPEVPKRIAAAAGLGTAARGGGIASASVGASSKQVSRAGAWQGTRDEGTDPSVPMSRAERMRLKLEEKRAEAEVAADDPKAAFKQMAAKALANMKEQRQSSTSAATLGVAATAFAALPSAASEGGSREEAEGDDELSMLPTADEEISAAAFLAAVKSRLVEWGKEDLYHEFVVALSGDVDAKAAVRILRGHHDLLRVFKSKFAPRADLVAIKQELAEEGAEDGPRPPRSATRLVTAAPRQPLSGAKEELGEVRSRASASFAAGSRAPTSDEGPKPPLVPPVKGVKRELVKGEVKTEHAIPRPPKLPPGAKRGTVTIGDDSDEDEEESEDEASILAAVRKGRDECVAQLAKLIFRKERAAHDGARARLSMVRYATHRAAVPRFPRELFLLRGAPGIGKTEYAMQQLADYVEFDPEDALAARLTHVCAADDFFERFTGAGSEALYKFDEHKVDSYHRRNETRVRVTMEAGIHPLFVDCTNLRLWEMKPYVELADKLGYVVSVVEPQDINEKFDDAAFLASATDTAERRQRGKVVPQGLITSFLEAFEPLQEDLGEDFRGDPLRPIRQARPPEGLSRVLKVIPVSEGPALSVAKGKGRGKGKNGGAKMIMPSANAAKRAAPASGAAIVGGQKMQRTSYVPPPGLWH